MYLTYFDESGDTGVVNSPTTWFVLNAVLVHETAWLETNEALVRLRRHLRDKYRISFRDELKAVHFKNGRGAFHSLGLSSHQRIRVYREVLTFAAQLNIRTFSIAIDKGRASKESWDPKYAAWAFALDTLNRLCEDKDERAVLFPDEGHGPFIRGCLRGLRLTGQTSAQLGPRPQPMGVDRVLEDPSDRPSHESLFVQIADLNAYAAHRAPGIDPRGGATDGLWECLKGPGSDIRIKEVNTDQTMPAGILVLPK